MKTPSPKTGNSVIFQWILHFYHCIVSSEIYQVCLHHVIFEQFNSLREKAVSYYKRVSVCHNSGWPILTSPTLIIQCIWKGRGPLSKESSKLYLTTSKEFIMTCYPHSNYQISSVTEITKPSVVKENQRSFYYNNNDWSMRKTHRVLPQFAAEVLWNQKLTPAKAPFPKRHWTFNTKV